MIRPQKFLLNIVRTGGNCALLHGKTPEMIAHSKSRWLKRKSEKKSRSLRDSGASSFSVSKRAANLADLN